MSTKKPQDHKPKQVKPKVEKVAEGQKVTISGKSVVIASDALDDWELLEDLAAMQEGQNHKIPSVARRMFGDSYTDALEQFRGKNGVVKASDFSAFVQRVFVALNPES